MRYVCVYIYIYIYIHMMANNIIVTLPPPLQYEEGLHAEVQVAQEAVPAPAVTLVADKWGQH